jgi:Gpi18-like mannosyltransferase
MLAPIDLLLFAAAAVFGLMLRLSVVSYTCLESPAYLRLGTGLKIATGCFDFLVAVLCALFVYELTAHKIKAFLAYAAALLLPVLVAGSGMWGMGDSIYLFFAVLSLYLLVRGNGSSAVVVYGISLFFNRYAFFLLPVFALAFMQKKAKLVSYLAPLCGVWFRNGLVQKEGTLSVPMFEAERLLTASRGDTLLSYNWPNLYQLIGPDRFVIEYGTAAKLLAATLMLCIVAAVLMQDAAFQKERTLLLAACCCVLFPFIMPQMDERSGLLADVLLVIFVMRCTEKYYLALLQVTISYIAYSAYFRGESVLPLSAVALAELGILLILLRDTIRAYRADAPAGNKQD